MKKLGFITESNLFNPLLAGLKKRGKNAERVDINSDLTSFDTLIIDLAYPLEQAYTLLQKIKNDYFFSETIIFAIISHRSQLTKLRSFVFGVDGYISPMVSLDDLILKLKEAHNPERHLVRKNVERIPLKIKTEGSLTHITESGAIIKSRASFSPDSKLKISSKVFKDLEIGEDLDCTISKSNPMAKRAFISEIDFLNLSDSDRDKIRAMIKTWSVE